MKQKSFLNISLIVLLMMLAFSFSALAQDDPEATPEPAPEEVIIDINASGSETITEEKTYVYTESTEDPAISVTTSGSASANVTVEEDVKGFFGGADLYNNGTGSISLKTGSIRGIYGILATLTDGTIEMDVQDLIASDDTALEINLSGSGGIMVSTNDILSDASAVSVVTGAESGDPFADDEEIDEPDDPGDDGWDDDEDWDDDEPYVDEGDDSSEGKSVSVLSAENIADKGGDNFVQRIFDSIFSFSERKAASSGSVEIEAADIESSDTAVTIEINDASKVSLTADGIYSGETGVSAAITEAGELSLETLVIDAENTGLLIDAQAGTVNVTAEAGVSARSTLEIMNDGAEVTLKAGTVEGYGGLYVETTDGTTTADTEDITAQSFGIYIRAMDAEQDSETEDAENASIIVTVNVDGDITDDIVIPQPSSDDNIEISYDDPEFSEDALDFFDMESGGTAKAAEDEASETDDDAESSGIIVEADAESTVEINVSGSIRAAYGNTVIADTGSNVSVAVDGDIESDYGNSLGAYDDAEVNFAVGGSLTTGGIALDTLAYDGTVNVSVSGEITVKDEISGDVTAGISAKSDGEGKTEITLDSGNITVSSEDSKNPVYGIVVDNTGGEISITVPGNVTASGGSEAIGMEIVNDPTDGVEDSYYEGDDADSSITTTVEIYGSLTGADTGLLLFTAGDNSKADVLVADTISGGSDSVVVNSDTKSPDNFDLTVWKIALSNGFAVVDEDGNEMPDVEKNVKYIVKIAEGQEDKVKAVDADGNELPLSHNYPYALQGTRVYLVGINGYEVTEAYNGRDIQTALSRDENGFYLDIPMGGAVWLSPEGDPRPEPTPANSIEMYRLSWLDGVTLPATGFSSLHSTELPMRPQNLTYAATGFTLQIPGIDVLEEIVTVPRTEDGYPVEWLGSDVGLLEQSELPGKGVTVLTGHNHLNTTDAGPFLFIGTLDAGDHIMINDSRNHMSIWQVYGNYKIAADGFAEIASEVRENALVLITCEDESLDGGYLNRRVILAEPM